MGFVTLLARMEVDRLMTEKIKNFEGIPFATNDEFEIFAEYIVINGFKFLQVKLIGPLQVNTLDGCSIRFEMNGRSMEIDSDADEIDTDFSETLGVGMTTFDIDLEDELIESINEEKIKSFQVSFNKKNIKFKLKDPSKLKSVIADL